MQYQEEVLDAVFLIADKNPDIRQYIKSLLESEFGLPPRTASTTDEVFEKLLYCPVDILITSGEMAPDSNEAYLKQVKEWFPHTRTVVISPQIEEKSLTSSDLRVDGVVSATTSSEICKKLLPLIKNIRQR